MSATTDADEEETYMIYSCFESTVSFYAKQSTTSEKEAIEQAIAEKGDENLLPIKADPQMREGFLIVRESDLGVYSHS